MNLIFKNLFTKKVKKKNVEGLNGADPHMFTFIDEIGTGPLTLIFLLLQVDAYVTTSTQNEQGKL